MAQIVVRRLDDIVKAKLTRRAKKHGRSTEDEVREILREVVQADDASADALGSRLAARFSRAALPGPVDELRQPARAARFDK
jgi:plasmid stability protein